MNPGGESTEGTEAASVGAGGEQSPTSPEGTVGGSLLGPRRPAAMFVAAADEARLSASSGEDDGLEVGGRGQTASVAAWRSAPGGAPDFTPTGLSVLTRIRRER